MPPGAHTLGSGGPEIEVLLLGAALLVLAAVFFAQKTAPPQVSVVLLLLGAVAVIGSFSLGGSAADVTVAIVAPVDGATVPAGEPVPVEVEVGG
ncbi:MAG: hypothetical protein M3273_08160, partial [Actinomycetota bacterium]|nr:hypothetical protein [Actinomycetota bacterium]